MRKGTLLVPFLAVLIAPPVYAQRSPVAKHGNYCYADLSEDAGTFRAVINTYRTPQGILILEVKKRQPRDQFINEPASFAVSLDYAICALLDETALNSPKNYLLRNKKYKLGNELAASELRLVAQARKACPEK